MTASTTEVSGTRDTESDGTGEFDPMAPNARRYPRVIGMEEISSLPRLEFNTGIGTAIFLSLERDDARYFRQGVCWMEADHAGYHWDQNNFDETHYCLEGM